MSQSCRTPVASGSEMGGLSVTCTRVDFSVEGLETLSQCCPKLFNIAVGIITEDEWTGPIRSHGRHVIRSVGWVDPITDRHGDIANYSIAEPTPFHSVCMGGLATATTILSS